MKRILVASSFCMALVFGLAAAGFSADAATLYKRCVSCHGPDGAKPPHVLKGQKAPDLLNKMKGYAAGTFGGSQKALMTNLMKPLSPEDMQALANYMAKF